MAGHSKHGRNGMEIASLNRRRYETKRDAAYGDLIVRVHSSEP